MGSISFLLPNPLPGAAASALGEACIASSSSYYDQMPTPTRVQVADGVLTLERAQNESGFLFIPWPVGPLGTVVVTSSTLRERAEPYRLLVELARGKLNQVRMQAGEWEGMGFQAAPEFDRQVADLTRVFGRAVLAPTPTESDALASQVLESAHALADRMARDFIGQTLANRQREEGRLDATLTARHGLEPTGAAAEEYARSFNAASVCFRWRDIEANEANYDWTQADAAVAGALAAGQPVTIGPMIDLAPGMLPEWAANWESDLPALAAFMCDYLETALHRYKDGVRRWIICAGFNHADALGLVDDDRLRLAYRLFEAAAQVDSGLELILSVAQPWGDYLVSEDQTISPLTFPDDLVRAGVRLSAIELELRLGTRPRGNFPRDLLDTAHLFHVFGKLGPALEVALSMPSAAGIDPLAGDHGETAWPPAWRSGPSPEAQAEWGYTFAALALCWPRVRAVTWDHWSDAEPHFVPFGGLLDAAGKPKPLLACLRDLRTAYLNPPGNGT
jgi:hypothetical protein